MKDIISEISAGGYNEIFYNSPAAQLIMAPDAPSYTILDVNNAYLAATNSKRSDLVGKSVFAVFPPNPTDSVSKNIERTIFSFDEVIRTKKPHVMSNYRYDIPIPGTNDFEERYWTTSNTPVIDENGDVKFFIHSPSNVTEVIKLAEREKAGIKALKTQRHQLYSLFMQAPVGIAILKGKEFFVEMANDSYLELIGKKRDSFVNRPLLEVLPEAKSQGFDALLNGVINTGIAYHGNEYEIYLKRNNKLERLYVNFVYEPIKENDGTISGIMAIAIEITNEVNARHQIEDAEERARLAVDAVGLGTYDLDLTTNEIITSTKFANIFGFKKPAPHNDYISVFHPDDLEVRSQAQKKAIEVGKIFYEARVIWKDKSVHWIRAEGKVFYNDNGEPNRILGSLLDITEQRKDKEEQRKLITLVDNSVDLMSILRMDGTNSYINEAGRVMLGFENEQQVLQTPIGELHAPQDLEFVEKEVLPTVMNKGKWAGEMRVRHLQTGEIVPVFNNCIRIDDPVSGEPIAVGAVMRDLRPEIVAKQALAESEQLLRNITTAAPTALWMSDEYGDVTYVNQTWITWTGYSFESHLGSGWTKAIVIEDQERAGQKFQRDLTARTLFEVEFRINHSDGSVHWCAAKGQPQYRSDGSFSGYIGSCSDITEQKYLQQQKDDFIGIASHELKTPVTSIKAYTQVLEKMLYKKEFEREVGMVIKIDSQINRLTRLIGDLLDVTKINSGKLQFNDSVFDFNQLIKEVVEDLQVTTENHLLIEDFQETGIVYADKERIGQVITNLITNAIKYSPGSGKIIISTELKDNSVTVCVEDFGIGISNDKLDKVFEQFYRVSGDMQHTFPGLGLGLYISSQIIKREGGRIWVNSIEGKGSTFCFSLPINDPNKK